MTYDLDRHHDQDSWLGDTPKPKGLPIVYTVERRFMQKEFQIFDLQFRYLVGELPPGFRFSGRHADSFNATLEVTGPLGEETASVREVLGLRTGLDWRYIELSNSDNDRKTAVMTAQTGTSWLPVPVWVSELASRIYDYRVGLGTVQITDGESNIFVQLRNDSVDRAVDYLSHGLFRGIPRGRINTQRVYYAHAADQDTFFTVRLEDWKILVAKMRRPVT